MPCRVKCLVPLEKKRIAVALDCRNNNIYCALNEKQVIILLLNIGLPDYVGGGYHQERSTGHVKYV